MWKVKSHLECAENYDTFETGSDAEIELHRLADDYAELMGAHVFHDDIGLSTVWDDDGEYICFWLAKDD